MKIRSWIALILLATAGFAEYYVYDSITSIDYLVKSALGFSGAEYGLLYSFYSVANVFLLALLFAGILVDYWGYQLSGLIFVSLCLIGAVLTAVGATSSLIPDSVNHWLSNAFLPQYSGQLKIMLLGRMIFGMGSEALLIVIMKALFIWFGKKHVAFAFAAALVLYRFGTFSALNLQVKVAQEHNFQAAFWLAAGIMLAGWLAYIIYLFVDRYFKPDLETEDIDEGKFQLGDVSSFPLSFWYLTLICITFYGSITSFEIFDPDILKQKFNMTPQQSGFLASVLMIATMVFMPILGFIIDKSGKRATLLVTGSSIAIIALFCFMYLPVPVISIFIIGLAYSLIATALWATVPIVIEKKCQGTAFGILSYIQNMGLMLFPWLSGYIADLYTKTVKGVRVINYHPMLTFFIIIMLASLIFSILLKVSDKQSVEEGATSMEEFKD